MRIGIVGTGGVGGLIAALVAHRGEAEVAVLARGAHLAAIHRSGLRLTGTVGDITVAPAAAARGHELGRCDVVFVAVKTWQLADVIDDIRAMAGDGALVVPLQNGITTWDRLAAALPGRVVTGGIIFVNSWVDAPGVIRQLGGLLRIVVGDRRAPGDGAPRPGALADRLAALASLLVRAGIQAEVADDITRTNWDKFLGFEPMALVGALSRSPIGAFRSDPATRRVLIALMTEVAAIGRRLGVAITDDAVPRRLAIIDGLSFDATISMQRDLMAGRPSELIEQSVELLALANELAVAVPAHEICVPLLVLHEQRAREVTGLTASPRRAG